MTRDVATEIHEGAKILRSFLSAFQIIVRELQELRTSVDKLTEQLERISPQFTAQPEPQNKAGKEG